MASRAEVTTRYAKAYVKASKKDRGLILDQVMSVRGWSRDNARRRLAGAAKRPPGTGRSVAVRPRKPRTPKYSYDALKILQRIWAADSWSENRDDVARPRLGQHGSPLYPCAQRIEQRRQDRVESIRNRQQHGIEG